MQFLSLSALSALVAAAGLVQAVPSAHAGADVLQRGSHHHRAIARDSRVARAAAGAVPPTLMKKGTKSPNRKCRIRPSQSSFIASPTSVPTVTGTVGNFNGTTASAAPTSSSDSASPTGSSDGGDRGTPWYVVRKHEGSSFFDNWNFWSLKDPTNGAVNYQDAGSSWNKGLVSINAQGQAIMAVDTTPNTGGYRDSVRIHDDQFKFNTNTLILMDSTHMPTGCGTWPAFWSNGDNWPYQGEIDILEGINDNTQNQATLHTSSGCTAVPDSSHPSTGNLLGNNCDVTSGNNIGCGYVDSSSSNNYGQGFNDINGGVYAMQWVATGISIWFFPRNSIPSDIVNEAPKPWTWPAPFAHWSASGCNPAQFFRDHYAIFDTTLCGDWAGSAWGSGGCAEKTGYSSCQDFVANQGGAFQQAYWAVNYVKYFQQN